jgi:hypothetical protein
MTEQPTGTGVIDPFLRLQETGPQQDGIQQGYNTGTGQPFQFDQKMPSDGLDGWTRNLLLSEVPIVNVGGTDYREFLLDINEPNAGSTAFLSLDQLQIFLSPTADLNNYKINNGSPRSLAGATEIYDMDAAFTNTVSAANASTSNWVKLNYGLNNGSGSGDMIVYIPNILFANYLTNTPGSTQQNTYVYLYSLFGAQSPYKISQAGFEEWWVRSQSGGGGGGNEGTVPEPGSLLLLGGGLVLLGRNLRKRLR